MRTPQVVFVGEAEGLWSDLERSLEDEGLESARASALPSRLERQVVQQTAAVVIGPDVTGSTRLTVCREVRAVSLASITVICREMDEIDQMRLVIAGVCDFASVPIRPRVLAAQLVNRIRRASPDDADAVLVHDTLQVIPREYRAMIDGRTLELTKTEFDLLAHLMDDPRRVHTHRELSRWLWDDSWAVDHHRLEAHVSRLRKKVIRAGGPSIIESVRGVGYRLMSATTLADSRNLAL